MEYLSRKRPFRRLGRVVDIINLILSVAVLVCAVLIVLNRDKNLLLFPVIFMCTSLINFVLGIKYYKRRENLKFIVLMLAFLAFLSFGIFSLIVVL